MPYTVPPVIKLEHRYNKPVKTGKTSKKKYLIPELSSRYDKRKNLLLEEKIQFYRLWYRFLQLALELDAKKVKMIIDRENVYYKKPKRNKYGHLSSYYRKDVTYPIKVNKKLYADWHIDEIPYLSFDKWWSSHKQLFIQKTADIIKSPKDVIDDPNYFYIKIDKRAKVNDTFLEIRNLLSQNKNKLINKSQPNENQKINYNILQNRYNALVLKISTKMTDTEILNSQYMRKARNNIVSKGIDKDDNNKTYSIKHPSRTIRDLLRPARATLLAVCEKHFLFNPNGKYMPEVRRKLKEKQKAR